MRLADRRQRLCMNREQQLRSRGRLKRRHDCLPHVPRDRRWKGVPHLPVRGGLAPREAPGCRGSLADAQPSRRSGEASRPGELRAGCPVCNPHAVDAQLRPTFLRAGRPQIGSARASWSRPRSSARSAGHDRPNPRHPPSRSGPSTGAGSPRPCGVRRWQLATRSAPSAGPASRPGPSGPELGDPEVRRIQEARIRLITEGSERANEPGPVTVEP